MKKIYFIAAFVLSATLLFAQSGSQTFTQTGIFVVPSGVSSVTVEVVGAGGSGVGNGSGGGGGGGYAKGVYNVTAGSNLAVTIGVGGSGAVNGTSSVSSFISATGGANGTTVSNPNIGGGGNGGTGINGNIVNRTGGNGGGGYWTYFGGGGGGAGGPLSNGTIGGNTIAWTGVCNTPGGSGGLGGGAPGGNGGKGAGFNDANCNVTNPAGGGNNYGGGGGGGNGIGSTPGVGANGYCNISWGAIPCTAPSSPTITSSVAQLTLCAGSATLTAASSGTINWYSSPSGGSAVGTGTTFITPVLTTTTTYYAEAVTCTNSISRTAVTVTVYPFPTIQVSMSSPTLCSGQTVTVNATGASTYSWSYASTPLITYSVGQTVAFSPSVSTAYLLSAADGNGCKVVIPFSLPVTPTPTLNVTTSHTVLCAGNISTITVSGSTLITYAPMSVQTGTLSSAGFLVKPPVSTTYTFTAYEQSGCSSSVTVFIEVNALPSLSVVSSNSVVCRLQTVTLTASGANTYTWSNTANSASILVNGLISNTTFTAIGTNSNGCSNSATYTQTVVNCTGISSNNQQESPMRIFPNPNKGEFSVNSDRNLKLNLVNNLGQLIKTFELNELNRHSFTITNVSVGIYFIISADASHRFHQKIVVAD